MRGRDAISRPRVGRAAGAGEVGHAICVALSAPHGKFEPGSVEPNDDATYAAMWVQCPIDLQRKEASV